MTLLYVYEDIFIFGLVLKVGKIIELMIPHRFAWLAFFLDTFDKVWKLLRVLQEVFCGNFTKSHKTFVFERQVGP